jgi:translocation and assembly module TamB
MRALRIFGWVAAALIAVPLLLAVLVLVLLNTGFGRGQVERLVGQLTAGQVTIAGLSGRFPDALRLAHAEIRDAKGPWLTLDGIALDWSPTRLLRREAQVDLLVAQHIGVLRLPVAGPAPAHPSADNTPFSLPIRVAVQHLRVVRADIGAPVVGVAAALALDGSAHLTSLQDGDGDVVIDRLDAPGSYAVQGRIDPGQIAARLNLAEAAGGLLASIAKLPDLGAIAVQASVAGPRSAEAANLNLSAGPLVADARGTVDLVGQSVNLDVSGHAPAMTPAPDVAWQAVALDAHVHGPFTKPDAAGTLKVTGLSAAGVAFASLTAQLQGNQGAAGLQAVVTGLRIPGPKPDLLAATPVTLQAEVRLDDPKRPVIFSLDHTLIQARGTADTGGAITAKADLTLPDLAALAAIGGVDLAGHAQLAVGAALAGGVTKVDVDGTVGITGGMAPIPALLGDAAKIGVSLAVDGGDITVSRAQIDGAALNVSAGGADKAGVLDLSYQVGLSKLAVLAPTVDGAVAVQGSAKGALDDLAVDAALTGDVGGPGIPRGPVSLTVHATGLPSRPAGTAVAQGSFEGAPLALDIDAQRGADGTLHATIRKADWKSLHAEGAVSLAAGATLPQGQVSLRMARLDDLRALIGQAVSGDVAADVTLGADAVVLKLEANHAGIPGSEVGSVRVNARVSDPLGHPAVDASVAAAGIEAGGIAGSANLTVRGPQAALALRLSAALQGLAGADATVATAATLDVPRKSVELASLSVAWKGQDIRLLTPARVSFADGVRVDRLRLGLQNAVLEVAGRATPTLDLTASLRGVTPDLAKPFDPGLDAAGQISADARLTGTAAAPQGEVHLTAAGLRLRTGPARSLPAANLTATARLAGRSATVDASLVAGRAHVTVTGRAPLGAGELALHAAGGVDLAMLDPILAAQGRRARGQVTLDATIGGTVAAPAVTGGVTLAGGEVEDFTQGVHITDLAATVQGAGQTVRIVSLSGRAGAGTISASGSVGLEAPMPVDLTVTMRKARALASDLLTADLDADLALKGAVQGSLAATGKISILRATINVPQNLPTSVAVLNVRIAGQPAPPPSKPMTIRLGLSLDTPGQIFIRGRGLDAVLGGSLQIAGTSAAPLVTGGFTMQHGTFSLAGTTLNFTRGKISFAGAGVTHAIDPSLDFEADSVTSNITAMLLVGGYASAPKITLQSSPPLPQDEVLSELLFGQSAKSISPFQYAEIAAALAQLTGAGGGTNPLDTVRKGLGLDRLSVGSGASSAAAGSSSNSATTIQAGKYVANGVYVGAIQGTSGSQTQATVEIDLFKGLKAVTDVGTGTGGNSVGLSYSFDY